MNDTSTPISPQIDDERFNFVGGFGEFLAAIATFILFVGLGILLFGVNGTGGISSFVYGNFAMLIGLCLVMSEYITRRKKLVGPSIVLSLIFYILAFGLSFYVYSSSLAGEPYSGIAKYFQRLVENDQMVEIAPAGLILLAISAYYARYKTPFAIGCVATAAHMLVSALIGTHIVMVDILFAFAVFGVALWYDAQDKTRESRKSDCAFWLHLVGAGILVSAIAAQLVGPLSPDMKPSESAPLIFLAIYAVLTLASLIINRRAIISVGLIYAAIALYTLLETAGALNISITALTMILIGAMVLALSLWWQGIRAKLMPLLPAQLQARFPLINPPPRRAGN